MEKKIGEVTHFFAGPSAAVLKLSSELKVGDEIHIVGFTTDLTERVTSMQINHNDVMNAMPGDDVAILVKDRVREGDEVFLAEKEALTEAPKMMAPAATPMATKPMAPPMPAAPKPAAPKPAAKPAAKPKAKAKAKPKAKPKAKAKAKPKSKAKAKKSKPKAKAKTKAKAKPKKKSKR